MDPGGLNNRNLFSHSLEAGKSEIKSGRVWFLVRALFLVSRNHLPTVSSHGGELASSLMSLLIRTLILQYQGPTLRTSFNLNYPLKSPISK